MHKSYFIEDCHHRQDLKHETLHFGQCFDTVVENVLKGLIFWQNKDSNLYLLNHFLTQCVENSFLKPT